MPSVGIYGRNPVTSDCGLTVERIKDKITNAISYSFGQIIDKIEFITETFRMLKEIAFIGKMSGTSAVSPSIYVRLMWKNDNPGEKFDKTNSSHILQLIDNYLQINQNWRDDPVIKKCMDIPDFLDMNLLNKYSLQWVNAKP